MPTRPESRLVVPLCGGFEVGQVLGQGFGFSGARQAAVLWAAILASAGVGIRVHPQITLSLTGELGIVPIRSEMTIEGLGTAFQVGRVFGRGLAGVQFHWGRGRNR